MREETGYSELDVIIDIGQQVVEFDHDGQGYVRTEHYFLMAPREPISGAKPSLIRFGLAGTRR